MLKNTLFSAAVQLSETVNTTLDLWRPLESTGDSPDGVHPRTLSRVPHMHSTTDRKQGAPWPVRRAPGIPAAGSCIPLKIKQITTGFLWNYINFMYKNDSFKLPKI